MITIKDSQNETVYALISHIAENIDNMSEYAYIVYRDAIAILRLSDNRTVLILHNKSFLDYTPEYIIEIVDLFNEAPLKEEYRKRSNEHYEKYREMSIPPPFLSSMNTELSLITYKYYYSEEMSFQQSTVHDNILPYDSTWDINTIRNKNN